MADTVRTKAALLALLANNQSGDISPQDVRDFLVSAWDHDTVRTFRAITSSDTLTDSDDVVLVDASSGAVTVTLPAAATRAAQYMVKKIDSSANAVVVDGNASETIDGATTQTLTSQYDAVTIASNATEWWIL